jgi:hypothetical protein
MTTASEPIPTRVATEPIPATQTKELQYRAIGLLWGRYVPRDEITQGILLTSDGTVIEAVVLGKLLGLLRSSVASIDLEKEHLWVVYPRTRETDPLHVQMCGIWEPETLHPDSPAPTLEQKPDYFSIQGEVIFQHKEENWVMVKILQKPRSPAEKPTYFKLKLLGSLPEKAVKNFWNLHVQREGNKLVVKDGERVAYLGKKKPQKGKPNKGKPNKGKPKRGDAGQQSAQPASPKEPPSLKKKQPGSSESGQQ